VIEELVIISLLVLANGVFAGAEIAVVALRKTRIQELADGGSRRARAVMTLRAEPERFLATVQVGITVVGATAAAFGGAAISERLAPLLVSFPWIGEHADGVALGLVVAAVSYLSIVIGELVPKSLALRAAERYALWIAKPLLWLSYLARPLVWFLSSSANLVLRPFGDQTTFTESRHSAEELQQLVEEASQAGTIDPEAGEIAARALELPDLTAADVMVPREIVSMVPRRASHQELRQILLEHTHNRMPVYEDRVDNVVGYINVKDLLVLAWEQRLIVLEDVIRAPYFVPESKNAVELLREMRTRHLPFAIVVDEHGGMSGIVTMEDLLEELVGDIFSEHEQVPQLVKKQPDGSVIVSGSTPIRQLNRELGMELPDDGAWTTLAGLCLARFERMPNVGEAVELPSGVVLEVADASPRRIHSVRIRRKTSNAEGADEAKS
jgi:putative hemolysin